MKFLVFLFALIIFNALGGQVSLIDAFEMGERIVNGYTNRAGEVPYIVTITSKLRTSTGETYYGRCGGSIIDHEWILTAAHCVTGAKSLKIGYGAIRRTEPQFVLTISRKNIYRHRDYSEDTVHNDIALIKTPFVNFTDFVNKIDLPTDSAYRNNRFAGTWAVVSGFGRTSDYSSGSDLLRSADVKVIGNDECSEFFSIFDSTLCIDTKGNGKSPCNGDSGGPLVLPNHATEDDKPRLIGVTSFGGSSCTNGYPGAFTRVTEYMDWIKKHSGVGN